MPDTSIEFYNAALDAIQAGRLTEALTAAENSLTENPSDLETWQLYVVILNALGRSQDAQKAKEKLKDLGMDEADGFLMKAAEATSSGDFSTAIAHYEAAIAAAPTRAEIHAGYALALQKNSRSDDALAAAEQARVLAPDDSRANYVLGHILRLRGEKQAALASLTKADAIGGGLALRGSLGQFQSIPRSSSRRSECQAGDPKHPRPDATRNPLKRWFKSQ
jgi:tetratricopeptide (TPR) repeat protein